MVENIYHHKLNIPVLFVNVMEGEQFSTTRQTELKLQNNLVNTEFLDWLATLGLTIRDSRFFNAPPFIKYEPHKDISLMSELRKRYTSCIKLNIIFNSVDSTMSWYTLKKFAIPIVSMNPVGEKLHKYPLTILDKTFEADVNGPASLINGLEIHTLHNGPTTRQCFSMPLHHKTTGIRITWSESIEIFKNYLTI